MKTKRLLKLFLLIGVLMLSMACQNKKTEQIKSVDKISVIEQENKEIFVVVTKTITENKKKENFMRMEFLSSTTNEKDITKRKEPGVQTEIITRILSYIIQTNSEIEGVIITEEKDSIEYVYKKYKDKEISFWVFNISKNGNRIMYYVGKNETTWKVLKKILQISNRG